MATDPTPRKGKQHLKQLMSHDSEHAPREPGAGPDRTAARPPRSGRDPAGSGKITYSLARTPLTAGAWWPSSQAAHPSPQVCGQRPCGRSNS